MKQQCHRFLFLALVAGIALYGCAMNINRDELLSQMLTEDPPLVVDVRSRAEYDQDHVPGALHIPFYSIGAGVRAIGYAKEDPIVFYCEHGPRASIAGFSLYLSGYDKVYSLEGHMKGWRKSEFPIEIIAH